MVLAMMPTVLFASSAYYAALKAKVQIVDGAGEPTGRLFMVDGLVPAGAEGGVTVTLDGQVVWSDNDPLAPEGAFKVAEGFYQNAATYTAATEFYITKKEGLCFFRDLVNSATADAFDQYANGGFTPLTIVQFFANNIFSGKTVKLLADIDLGNEGWTPIGNSKTFPGGAAVLVDKPTFYGTFDGCDHKISNLKIDNTSYADKDGAGLFGRVANRAAFKNLTIENVDIHAQSYVGALCGNAGSGTPAVVIDNVQVVGSIQINGHGYVGGLVGHGLFTVTNCSVVANGGTGEAGKIVSRDWQVGGISGTSRTGSSFTDCKVKNIGIEVQHYSAGGITGNAAGDVTGCTVENVTIGAYNASSSFDAAQCGTIVGRLEMVEAILQVTENLPKAPGQCGIYTQPERVVVGWDVVHDASGKIVGGTFEKCAAEVIADGYELIAVTPATTPATFAVAEIRVAQIGATGYASIEAAIQAFNAITTPGDYTVEIVKPGTHVLSDLVIRQDKAHLKSLVVTAADGAQVTLKSGSIASPKTIFMIDGQNSFSGGPVTFRKLTFDLAGGAYAVTAMSGNEVRYAHNLTIDGCSFVNSGDTARQGYIFGAASGSNPQHLIVTNCSAVNINQVGSGYFYGQAGQPGIQIVDVTLQDCKAVLNNQSAGAWSYLERVTATGCANPLLIQIGAASASTARLDVLDSRLESVAATDNDKNKVGLITARSQDCTINVKNTVFAHANCATLTDVWAMDRGNGSAGSYGDSLNSVSVQVAVNDLDSDASIILDGKKASEVFYKDANNKAGYGEGVNVSEIAAYIAKVGDAYFKDWAEAIAASHSTEPPAPIVVLRDPAAVPAPDGWAFATRDGITTLVPCVAQTDDAQYASLADAIAAVPEHGAEATAIKMIANETVAEEATLSIVNKKIALDLNGCTVSGSAAAKTKSFYWITLGTGAELTIDDTSEGANGAISFQASEYDAGFGHENNTIYNCGGKLTLRNGTVRNLTGGGLSYAINISANAWSIPVRSFFTMEGGRLSAPHGDAALRIVQNAHEQISQNSVIISGGEIVDTGIFVDTYSYVGKDNANSMTVISVTGGTVNGLIDCKLRNDKLKFDIAGGTFGNCTLRVRRYVAESVVTALSEPVMHISGGSFTFANGGAFVFQNWVDGVNPYAVSGGLFNVEPPAVVLATGYAAVAIDSGWAVGAVVDIGDGEGTQAVVVTPASESAVDEEELARVVDPETTAIVNGNEVHVAEKIVEETKVEGIKLTAEAESGNEKSGIRAVIDAAMQAAGTEFEEAVNDAGHVEVKVEVKVAPVAYQPPTDEAAGYVAFSLKPEAKVSVNSGGTTLEQTVPVTNDMIDRNQKIAVTLFTGFRPQTIVHADDAGNVIEIFKGDDIAYDAATGVVTILVSHFSTIAAFEHDFVAKVGETYYATLAEAIAAVQDGETITILDDIDVSGQTLEISRESGTYALDLAGHVVKVAKLTVQHPTATTTAYPATAPTLRVFGGELRGTLGTANYGNLWIESGTYTASSPTAIQHFMALNSRVVKTGDDYVVTALTPSAALAGSGTKTDPYQIGSVEDALCFRNGVNAGTIATYGKWFKLTADIDLDGLNWRPIGTAGRAFQGNFDGGGRTISNLYIYNYAKVVQLTHQNQYTGFFGHAWTGDNYITFKDVTFNGVTITAGSYQNYSYIGALVGFCYGGITNVNLTGAVNFSPLRGKGVGGIVGYFFGNVEDCDILADPGSCILANANNGSTAGFAYYGGIVGYDYAGENHIAYCDVKNMEIKACFGVGGIVGKVERSIDLLHNTVENVSILELTPDGSSQVLTDRYTPQCGLISGCTTDNNVEQPHVYLNNTYSGTCSVTANGTVVEPVPLYDGWLRTAMVDPEARIGSEYAGKYHATLAGAVAAAQPGDIVTLLADNLTVTLAANQSVIIDVNGHSGLTLTTVDGYEVVGSDGGIYTSVPGVPMLVWVDDDFTPATEGWGVTHFASIRSAVAGVAAGGTVYIANGLYIDSNTTLDKAVTLIGESRDGVVVAPAAEDDNLTDGGFTGVYQHGFVIASSDVTVTNLTIDGQANAALTAGKCNFRAGVMANGDIHSNVVLASLTVRNTYLYGINMRTGTVGQGGTGSAIRDCWVENMGFNAYPSLGIYSTHAGEIAGNTVTNAGYRGIYVYCANMDVYDNTVWTGDYDPLYGSEGICIVGDVNGNLSPTPVTRVYRNTIHVRNNVIKGIGMNVLYGVSSTFIGGETLADGNVIYLDGGAAADDGIECWWTKTGQPVIQNNTVYAAGEDSAVWMFINRSKTAPANAAAPILKGNRFYATDSDGTEPGRGTGVFMTDDMRFFGDGMDGACYAILKGNLIEGFARGIDLYRSGNGSEDYDDREHTVQAVIGGTEPGDANMIQNCDVGVRLFVHPEAYDGPLAKVCDATIQGNNAATFVGNKIAILLDGGTASVTRNGLYDNEIAIKVMNGGSLTTFADNAIGGEDVSVLLGLVIEDGAAASAVSNWWGSAAGPSHAANPGGTGALIVGEVAFTPWYSDAELSNLVPYNLRLDNATIGEHAPIGSVVGNFAADDDDTGDMLVFRLADGDGTNDTGNASFVVEGAALKTAIALSYAKRQSYRVFVEVDDGRGGTNRAALVITVLDENDPPVAGHIRLVAVAGHSLAFDPLDWCKDIDGDALTVIVPNPPAGLDTARQDGLLGFLGETSDIGTTFSFPYTVSDGELSTEGLIEIEVVETDEEYLRKTMKVTTLQASDDGSTLTLRFSALMPVAARGTETTTFAYKVMQCSDLLTGVWVEASGLETTFIPSADGYYGEMVVVIPLSGEAPRMFFKIQATFDEP